MSDDTMPETHGMRRDSQMPPTPRISATIPGVINQVTT
jgi:hypothetical protein